MRVCKVPFRWKVWRCIPGLTSVGSRNYFFTSVTAEFVSQTASLGSKKLHKMMENSIGSKGNLLVSGDFNVFCHF